MQAAVAAGHPATAQVGAQILSEGGNAADAAVAASLASCVAETVMTGLLGGGHAIYFDAPAGRAWNLDCFVAVPGLGAEPRQVALLELEVPFGTELVHYAVGIASCGVPGLPGGLGALWERFGTLPWRKLVEPALRLAATGVELPPAHASCLEMLAPVMTMNEGAQIYAPAGSLLASGDLLEQPGLTLALEALAAEGPGTAYRGSIASSFLELMAERSGLVTAIDLAAYQPCWYEPVEVDYRGLRFLTRGGFSRLPKILPRLPEFRGLAESERALAWADTLSGDGDSGHTTNLTVVDAEGSACVFTSSLGLGSGDFVPGLDLHLNSMLGEVDLLRKPLGPGSRMDSMMAPSVVLRPNGGLELAIGAAGGTRLRGALLQVAVGILDEGLAPLVAVDRPRLHAVDDRVQLEPGFSDETIRALEQTGYEVRVWPTRHHFFGGVSLVTPTGAAGDPRRSGAAVAPAP